MPHDKVQAKLKAEYRRSSVTLLGGLEFRKDGWTDIPPHKIQEAKRDLGDYLDFQTLSEEEQETAVLQGTPTGYTPDPFPPSVEEEEGDPLEEPWTTDEMDASEEEDDIPPKKPSRSKKPVKKKPSKEKE